MIGKTNVKIKPNKKIDYVKYIESTGTQYIDTGIVPKSTTRMEIKLKFNNITNTDQRMGWGASGGAEAFMIGADSATTNFCSWVSSSYAKADTGIPLDTEIHVYDIKSGSQKFDGVEYATDVIGDTAVAGQTIHLFCMEAEWTTELLAFCYCNVYYCKIYDGETLVRDYRPAKSENDELCFYEKVSQKYVTNQGTGEFVGDDYEPTQIEYLENTGTQWIDTGIEITPENHTRFRMEIDMSIVSLTNNVAIMGIGGESFGNCVYVGTYGEGNWFYGNGAKNINMGIAYDNLRHLHIYDVPNLTYKLDNTEIKMSLNSPKTANTFILFGHKVAENVRLYGKFRLYGAKIYFDDVLIKDYIAAKDPTGTKLLYDKVEKTFAPVSGTGTFNGGQELKKFEYVEYIESTGTQYIDTGILASGSNLSWRLKFAWAEIPTSSSTIIGAFVYGGANGTTFAISSPSNRKFCYQYGSTSPQIEYFFGTIDTNIHVIESNIEAGVMKFDGETHLTNCGYSEIPNTTVYLFAGHRQGQTSFWLEGSKRIYSCEMYENGVLVGDFRPCKDETGVYFLYNNVKKTYHYNQGTGSFLGGAKV